MKNLIRVSDSAGHGGKVETGSTTMRFDGRYVARKGDHVRVLSNLMSSPMPSRKAILY